MLTSRIKLRLIGKLLVLAVLITVAAFTLFGRRQVYARPCHEVEHHYFADETYGEEVGEKWLYCNGTYQWGQVTQYDLVIDGYPCCFNCPSWCE